MVSLGRGATTRFVVPLGHAELEGRVFDLDGHPVPDARVVARQAAASGESAAWFAARTDARGAYRIARLAGGADHTLYAMVPDVLMETAPRVELELGATRRLDFGSPVAHARLHGTVRFRSGEPLGGPARMTLVARDRGTVHDAFIDAHGEFAVVLPGGPYEARLASADGPVLGAVEVGGDTQLDLEVPGVVLRGRVKYVGTKHPRASGPEGEVVIALETADGVPVRSPLVRGEAGYAFCGLAPGEYVLSSKPWILADASDGRASVRVGAGVDELVQDSTITDP